MKHQETPVENAASEATDARTVPGIEYSERPERLERGFVMTLMGTLRGC